MDGDEKKPAWGKALICYRRFADPEFGDFSGRILRKSETGQELPNPRVISNSLMVEKKPSVSETISQMLMNWGQVLANEMTYPAGVFNFAEYDQSPCCTKGYKSDYDDCAKVDISPVDPYYSKYNYTCFNFVRGPACIRCKVKPRAPLNLHTSFIDASTLYGNCVADANRVREFKGGLLKDAKKNMLQVDEENDDPGLCERFKEKFYPQVKVPCFTSGDTYVNNNPYKTALVMSLFRLHNQIAVELVRVNPFWDDETLFQETRRIVGAKMQMITFNEFLPLIINERFMSKFNLTVLEGANYTEYHDHHDASSSAVFTASAMRSIGHSMINGNTYLSYFNGTKVSYPLKNYWFYQSGLRDGQLDALIRGSITEPIASADIYMDDVARNLMMRVHPPYGPPYGIDMAVLDIMRGRDFGVASYSTFRKNCARHVEEPGKDDIDEHKQEYDTWESFTRYDIMSQENAVKLSHVYSSPKDVDLYIGMLMENTMKGSLMGNTGNCIWATQFHLNKFGDRYYFEHSNTPGAFTPRQLRSLRKITLAKILCMAGNEYPKHKIQPYVMLLPSETNKEVPCLSLYDLDWEAWKAVNPSG